MPYHWRMNPIECACSTVGGLSVLAAMVGVKPPTVSQWVKGDRPVPVKQCTAIERATGGAVTRKDLRPDDWADIWPELANSEANPAEAPAKQAQAAIKPVAQGVAT